MTAASKDTIAAHERLLLNVFSDEYVFTIPRYQRPYSWQTEQAGDLFDDLVGAMGDSGGDVAAQPPYFLGSIVLIKSALSPKADVVDGQQRLTTLTILLSALREISEGASVHQLHKYICATGDAFAGTEDLYRLSIRSQDQDIFETNIQTPGALAAFVAQGAGVDLKDSQLRILENARFLRDKLLGLPPQMRVRLGMFLIQRCYLVVVSASDRESAYRIFAVMNDRGLDLSPTDILKAVVTGALPEKYVDVWDDLEEELGRDGFRDLFSHIRMVFAKRKMQRTLSAEFEESVLARTTPGDFVDKVLKPYAKTFAKLSEGFEGGVAADETNRLLHHLRRLDNFDWIPPALAYLARHSDETARLDFVRDLERLAYAMFVLRYNVNARLGRYAAVLDAVERDHAATLAKALDLNDAEKADVRAALDGPIYPMLRVRLPLLQRLDSLLAASGVSYDPKVVSIEHVLPQTPADTSGWTQTFPDAALRAHWVHRLANLVLLSRAKNSQASNYDFDVKKTQYFNKGNVVTFALTSQVLNEPIWTPAVLDRRQRTLVDALATEWRL